MTAEQGKYIDSFFNNELSSAENEKFEEACANDKEFAEVVAEYAKIKYGFLKIENEKKKARFDTLAINKKLDTRVFWATAASILLVSILGFLYFKKTNTNQLAKNYVNAELSTISSKMGVNADSMQIAIEHFNNKNYEAAADIFEKQIEHGNAEAINYTGLCYLKLKQYDAALIYFEKLERLDLKVNEGAFLQVVTLLSRNQKGDSHEAYKIAKNVIDEELEGSVVLKRWGY